MNLGNNEIYECYIGSDAVSEAYLGDVLVFSSGPFEGLKASPSTLKFNSRSLTKTIKVISSESWTMDIPSWVSADVLSGIEGETTVTITADVQSSNITGTISITSANYSASVGLVYVNRDIIVPDDEMWYKADSVITPFRPASWFTDPILEAQGLQQQILSNEYDSSDGWYKIKWAYPLRTSAASGFYGKDLFEVAYPDTFIKEAAENFVYCSKLKTIYYGECDSLTLDEGSWPPNLTAVYCYSKTEPQEGPYDSRGNYGRNVTTAGVFHYPSGANWENFISTLPARWTAVDDLGGTTPAPTPSDSRTVIVTGIPTPSTDCDTSNYARILVTDYENIEVDVECAYDLTGMVWTTTLINGDPSEVTYSFANGVLTVTAPFGDNVTIEYDYNDCCEHLDDNDHSDGWSWVDETDTEHTFTFPTLISDVQCDCERNGDYWDENNSVCIYESTLTVYLGDAMPVEVRVLDSNSNVIASLDYDSEEDTWTDNYDGTFVIDETISGSYDYNGIWEITGRFYGTYDVVYDTDSDTDITPDDGVVTFNGGEVESVAVHLTPDEESPAE